MSSAFVIAAPSSGSGKTSLSLGLLQALQNRALNVQSFKCGPDYIDTLLHSSITGKPGINLDLFFNSADQLRELFYKYSKQSDISVVEGVMGLFDGFNRAEGSTASIAKSLNLPVVLIVDAKASAYSIAPILYGFKHFDPEIKLAGVIFNRVGSEGHYQYLKEAADDIEIPVLGYLPNNKEFHLPERYLGLNFDEQDDIKTTVNKIANQISKTLNLDLLLQSSSLNLAEQIKAETISKDKGSLKIAVSKDEAFTFTYYENLQGLSALGEIEYFSPLHDNCLPNADFVYLSGGYPEKHLEKLSKNHSMIESIQKYIRSGGKMLAECGGMMYLGKQIIDDAGNAFSMAGIFDFDTSMKHKKLHLGYRKLELGNVIVKGHEFHYSEILIDKDTETCGRIVSAKDNPVNVSLYKKNNCYASYMHIYWGHNSIYNILFNTK
ncbi:MAG: cobyrinate a,c-diamide synthase [Bacteroidales bacterium]|nr:cobyrinate a,c-diamide synthase [Bacteroidales bacterium]